MRILVTGGSGFIGSAFIRFMLSHKEHKICNVDKLTYAVNPEALSQIQQNLDYQFICGDICDSKLMSKIFEEFKPDKVVHFAAESHVDNSISEPENFIQTNIVGTYQLLQSSLNYWQSLKEKDQQLFCFLHISTDEVFGDLDADDQKGFHENSAYRPSSPYSASKSASDHLVRAWYRTYGLPIVITNCSNNYGPFQHNEKLIPKIIDNAMKKRSLTIYGSGMQVRDWIHVDDHVRALDTVLKKGEIGETYLIGSNCEKRNIDVVKMICSIMDEVRPINGFSYDYLIEFIEDRNGHDFRYAIDSSKIRSELSWAPIVDFGVGLEELVKMNTLG